MSQHNEGNPKIKTREEKAENGGKEQKGNECGKFKEKKNP